MTLPKPIFDRAFALLKPHVRTQDDQVALLTRVFYDQRWILDQIKFGGAAVTFASLCLSTLDTIGCSEGVHPAGSLIEALSDDVGVQLANEIKVTAAGAHESCSDQGAVPAPQRTTPEPVRQTTATPLAQRQPTVFLIYAEKDGTWVDEWLIPQLSAAGIACWDGTLIGGFDDEYKRLTQEGINNSYAVIVVSTPLLAEHRWARLQLLWAREKRRPVFKVQLGSQFDEAVVRQWIGDAPVFVLDAAQHADGMRQLLAALPVPRMIDDSPGRERIITQRWLELLYLDYLRFERTLEADRVYTELAGSTTPQRQPKELRFGELRQLFELQPRGRDEAAPAPPRRFEDAVTELLALRRAVVLGEPGAGKSTTLEKVAAHLAQTALKDRSAPVPLLMRLGRWTRADQTLEAFIAAELGELGKHLDVLLRTKRAALLLDGLNEIPVEQRGDKTEEIAVFWLNHPELQILLTCREQDYLVDIGLSSVVILPLDPLRIREFARHHLGDAPGTELFYRLAGDGSRWEEEQFKKSYQDRLPNWEHAFWLADERPKVKDDRGVWQWHWDPWKAQRDAPDSLLVLARNPYMLRMLCDVYSDGRGELPANRGALFGAFAERLLRRERLSDVDARDVLAGLERLAWRMQERRAVAGANADPVEGNPGAGDGALTVLIYAQAIREASPDLLRQAASASMIEFGALVRFTHQLLQEYFTARAMETRIQQGMLHAVDIWPPERFWVRTNWEEATVILAGLHSRDCSDIVEWVADASPDVAAQCAARSGAHVPDATLLRLRERWLPRLTDTEKYPGPHARANAGRALGRLRLSSGELLDNRAGVGVIDGVPDIDWVDIPAGQFLYGGDGQSNNPPRKLRNDAFKIARYPVTYAQFQAFIDADDGWRNPHWWVGLSADHEQMRAPGEQSFKYWNHPRESVSWFDAVAFCGWLSARLGAVVTLPTEQQWERAARHIDGRAYPWGDEYGVGHANTSDEKPGIGATTAVGAYPSGRSVEGVDDLTGNVWEWCLNEYHQPERVRVEGDARRVLRGGSWSYFPDYARAAYRSRNLPSLRDHFIGFRLVVGAAPVR